MIIIIIVFIIFIIDSIPKNLFVNKQIRYPNLLKWYEAMDQRESYAGIKSDYVRTVRTLIQYQLKVM